MQPRRLVPAVIAAVALSGVLTSCGNDDASAPAPVKTGGQDLSAADRACREQWQSLQDGLLATSTRGMEMERVFASQWGSIRAGVSYYEGTARATQCGKVLTDEKEKIDALARLVRKALPYDIEQLRAKAVDERDAYIESHPKGKEPKRVRAAYRTLHKKDRTAQRDISPAVDQLARIDPRDPKAVKAAFKDVALLAETSDAFQACKKALAAIKAFHHPKQKSKHKKSPKK